MKAEKASARCTWLHELVFESYLKPGSKDTVLIVGNWRAKKHEALLAETLDWFKAQQIPAIVLGPAPAYAVPLPRLLAFAVERDEASAAGSAIPSTWRCVQTAHSRRSPLRKGSLTSRCTVRFCDDATALSNPGDGRRAADLRHTPLHRRRFSAGRSAPAREWRTQEPERRSRERRSPLSTATTT